MPMLLLNAHHTVTWVKNQHWYLGVVSTVAILIWADIEISSLRRDARVTNLKTVALAYVSGGAWKGIWYWKPKMGCYMLFNGKRFAVMVVHGIFRGRPKVGHLLICPRYFSRRMFRKNFLVDRPEMKKMKRKKIQPRNSNLCWIRKLTTCKS